MQTFRYLSVFIVLSWLQAATLAQTSEGLHYSGQLSGWGQYAPDQTYNWLLGGRYIPKLTYSKAFANRQKLGVVASLNIYGTTSTADFDSTRNDGKIEPYRLFVTYSFVNFTLQGGLQPLHFGSAQIFHSTAWFGRTDPRDPLQISDGVWGVTGRYYFPGTKINLWMWLLYGNKDAKGTDFFPTDQSIPEMGGRLQWQYPLGDFGFSYHYRRADIESLNTTYMWASEHRFGLDARFNWSVGVTIEASSIHLSEDAGIYTHQSLFTLGFDHTFGIGNGLKTNFEQFVSSLDQQSFMFDNTITLSGLSLTYPIAKHDNLSYMLFYDWTYEKLYNYATWTHRFKHLTLHTMAFWNPELYEFDRIQAFAQKHLLGKGLKLMLVWNH